MSEPKQRPRKILIVGASGYDTTGDKFRVVSVPWSSVTPPLNASDFDDVVVSVLSKPTADAITPAMFDVLNATSVRRILSRDGRIIVVGDPRFTVKGSAGPRAPQVPFLDWTGFDFIWDEQPGDAIELRNDRHGFNAYMNTVTRYGYSVRAVAPNLSTLAQLYDVARIAGKGNRLEAQLAPLWTTRYDFAIAFGLSLNLVVVHPVSGIEHRRFLFGSIFFVPESSLMDDEALSLLVSDACGIEVRAPEPEWVVELVPPGQSAIDRDLTEVNQRITSDIASLNLLKVERRKSRECLQLLYGKDKPLEVAVRDVFRKLTAEVDDPLDRGKEDGVVRFVNGDRIYEGVLEVKGTKRSTLDEGGLKQLRDWQDGLFDQHDRWFKGILVANASIDLPPKSRGNPFSDSWLRKAERSDFVALRSVDLYRLYEAAWAKRLDVERFWTSLFETKGLFVVDPFIEEG